MAGINTQATEREPVFREILKQVTGSSPVRPIFLSAIRTENIRMALARSRETVLMRETPERTQGFEFAQAATPGGR